MQELVEKLKAEAGLTDEQAKKALETIKTYVVEKFPMLEGAVQNLFAGEYGRRQPTAGKLQPTVDIRCKKKKFRRET